MAVTKNRVHGIRGREPISRMCQMLQHLGIPLNPALTTSVVNLK